MAVSAKAKREFLAGVALAPEGGVPTDPSFLGLGGEVDGDKSRMLSNCKVANKRRAKKGKGSVTRCQRANQYLVCDNA